MNYSHDNVDAEMALCEHLREHVSIICTVPLKFIIFGISFTEKGCRKMNV